MNNNTFYYKTDLGIIVKFNNTYRLKSTYELKKEISKEDFDNSNPIKLKKNKYLEELNIWFKNNKHEWKFEHSYFKKLDNFEIDKHGTLLNYKWSDFPKHKLKSYGYGTIVLFHSRLYYAFFDGNAYPQMLLCDFLTKEFTGKYTNIRNLSPVFNIGTKQII